MLKLKEMKQRLAALVEEETAWLQLASQDGHQLSDEERARDAARAPEIAKLHAEVAEQEGIQERLTGSLQERPPAAKIDPADKPFRTFGEQLSAVALAERSGGRGMDNRLLRLAPSGAGETFPSDGGFLVQEDFSRELLKRTYETGQILSRTRQIEIGPNSANIKIPYIDESSRVNGSRWGGVQVYRANEADTVTASKPKYGRLEIDLEKLMGLCYATDELLQDSTALESIVRQAFPSEMSFKIEDEIINGDGAGKALGILKSDALVTVLEEASQAAATLLPANIIKMRARLWAPSRTNSVWFINQDVEPQLHLMQLGTAGPLVYMPANGLSASPFDTLFGRPVIPVEYCASLGTVGDVILADMSQYIVITKGGGLRADSSMHVRFINDEMTFRFTWRVNGQPAWKKALTPFKGSATLSPFVTIETR